MLAIEDVGNRIPQIAVQFADCLCPELSSMQLCVCSVFCIEEAERF